MILVVDCYIEFILIFILLLLLNLILLLLFTLMSLFNILFEYIDATLGVSKYNTQRTKVKAHDIIFNVVEKAFNAFYSLNPELMQQIDNLVDSTPISQFTKEIAYQINSQSSQERINDKKSRSVVSIYADIFVPLVKPWAIEVLDEFDDSDDRRPPVIVSRPQIATCVTRCTYANLTGKVAYDEFKLAPTKSGQPGFEGTNASFEETNMCLKLHEEMKIIIDAKTRIEQQIPRTGTPDAIKDAKKGIVLQEISRIRDQLPGIRAYVEHVANNMYEPINAYCVAHEYKGRRKTVTIDKPENLKNAPQFKQFITYKAPTKTLTPKLSRQSTGTDNNTQNNTQDNTLDIMTEPANTAPSAKPFHTARPPAPIVPTPKQSITQKQSIIPKQSIPPTPTLTQPPSPPTTVQQVVDNERKQKARKQKRIMNDQKQAQIRKPHIKPANLGPIPDTPSLNTAPVVNSDVNSDEDNEPASVESAVSFDNYDGFDNVEDDDDVDNEYTNEYTNAVDEDAFGDLVYDDNM